MQAQAHAAFAPDEYQDNRTIFLLDYDSFFARCMQQAYPPLRGKPMAVRGPASGAIIIAASTEAKALGIKTGTPLNEAKSLCPNILFVPPDMDMYVDVCTKSLRVLTSYTNLVEPFSIDEAFIDVTDLMEVYDNPQILAQHIKQDLRMELGDGITCSIGIAPNKMLAKLVSHFHKPDGITRVLQNDIPELVKRIALIDICGIGPRVLKRLNRLGIYTVEQLGRFPRDLLVREFGVLGNLYWLWGRGMDLSPVTPYHQQDDEKSIGHTQTMEKPVYSRGEVDGVLMRLCERVGRRLRSKRFMARTFHMWLSFNDDPGGIGGRRTMPHAVDSTMEIYAEAQRFMPTYGLPHPIRRVSVCVSNLCRGDMQLSLVEDRLKKQKLQQMMDAVNDKYGELTVAPAAHFKCINDIPRGGPVNALRKRYAVDNKDALHP